jgi:hypothetical protein
MKPTATSLVTHSRRVGGGNRDTMPCKPAGETVGHVMEKPMAEAPPTVHPVIPPGHPVCHVNT